MAPDATCEGITQKTGHPKMIRHICSYFYPSDDLLDTAEDDDEIKEDNGKFDDCTLVEASPQKPRLLRHIEEYPPAAEDYICEHPENLLKRPPSTGTHLFTIKEQTVTKSKSLMTQGRAASVPSLMLNQGMSSKANCKTPSNVKTRPAWNDSWSDDWFKHHSQRCYIDPLHNQPHYSVMHYREGSPGAKILLRAPKTTTSQQISRQSPAGGNNSTEPAVSEKIGSPKSSSRESISSCTTHTPDFQDSPLQSSRCSVDSSCMQSLPDGTTSSSHGTSRDSVASGSDIRESVRLSGKHGFRSGLHGSTGKPWQTSPFYNDREHPFLGHYFDRSGLEAASRRGRLSLSDFSVIPPDVRSRTSKLALARRRRDALSSSGHRRGRDDFETCT